MTGLLQSAWARSCRAFKGVVDRNRAQNQLVEVEDDTDLLHKSIYGYVFDDERRSAVEFIGTVIGYEPHPDPLADYDNSQSQQN